MPELPGTLKPPRLSAAPSSPVLGQTYFDTTLNKLRWWNGSAWVFDIPEVHIGTTAPSPRDSQVLWVDTT